MSDEREVISHAEAKVIAFRFGAGRNHPSIVAFLKTGRMRPQPEAPGYFGPDRDNSVNVDSYVWSAFTANGCFDIRQPEEQREALARFCDYLMTRKQRGEIGRVPGWRSLPESDD